MMTRSRISIWYLALVAFEAACGKNAIMPTAPAPELKQLSLSGRTSLTALGQTSQLKAIATFADGTAKDVTADTSWTSEAPSVIDVSPTTGLVTVQRFGASTILGRYPKVGPGLVLVATIGVVATPDGTLVVVGDVYEPGEGGVAGVAVTDTASGLSTQSVGTGAFTLGGLSNPTVHLRFEKDGFEPAELDGTAGVGVRERIQAVIRIPAGEMATAHRLAPNDLSYSVGAGQRCTSCRLVRVVSPVKGMLHVQVTWANDCTAITLGIWNAGHHVVPSNPVNSEVDLDTSVDAGETIFFVDRVAPVDTTCHVPFVVATTLTE